jgi:hypothetical protein
MLGRKPDWTALPATAPKTRPLGIEAADVVVEVNGVRLTGMNAFHRFLVEVAHAPAFEMVVRSPSGMARTVRPLPGGEWFRPSVAARRLVFRAA